MTGVPISTTSYNSLTLSDGVLIHPGNSASDTEGCIIPGKNDKVGLVSNSTNYFKELYNKMKIASKSRGEKITIEIV